MQGKGIVKFFLVVIILVCVVQYLFMLPTSKVEKDADEYAQLVAAGVEEENAYAAQKAARTAYLDSMSSEEIFSIPLVKKYTYEELKRQQLALGLDLKGGMSVVLQVDLSEFIRAMARDSRDPTFNQALENASHRLRSAQSDFVTLFADEFRKLADGKSLAQIFARNPALRDEINFETSDGDVVRLLRNRANETVNLTFTRLKDRIDKLGVVQPNVSLDAARDLIIVELPGVDNPERARSYLQSTAKLEFWNVYRITDPGILDAFIAADDRLKRIQSGDTAEVEEAPSFRIDSFPVLDSLGNTIPDSFLLDTVALSTDPAQDLGPLREILQLNVGAGGTLLNAPAVMGSAAGNERDEVTEMLNHPQIKPLFPRDLAFRWARQPEKDLNSGEETNFYNLYAIRLNRGTTTAPLEGDRVTDARENMDPMSNAVVVSLKMDNQGARVWADMTTKAAQDNNREIAIVLDDEVVSAPRVNGPITGGDSQIEGGFTLQEAKDLANILQVGKLPAKTRIIQQALVGPSLGADNIARSIRSLMIGFGLLVVFMILYYGTGGIVSIVALFANLFFIFGALASVGTVLTLPGIAGIVLTIGMAVDANVIIYERIREELRIGKTLAMAVKDGFQNSYSAIIDANVTTILTAIVLAYFGLGPIKGFAVVLIIGVISSLFTAVLVGRLIIDWWLDKGRNLSFFTPPTKNVFANLNLNWLGMRRIGYTISALIIAAGIFSFFTKGFELGVDFKGGHSYNVQLERDIETSADDIRNTLTTVFGSTPVVKKVDLENTFNVTTSFLIDDTSDDADDRVMARLFEGINSIAGGDLVLENFSDPDGQGTHITSFSKVGPTIADDIKTSSVYATVFALLLIFLYIFIRFSKWQYSIGAVAALFHDTLIVLGVFSIFSGILPFSLEIDQAFIAALLTVIGYSINDTVVVFDRIREYLNSYTGKGKRDVINMAVNSTISRTIITSLTTMVVIGTLFLFGGSSIKGFAFAILIGIVVGTYSSVFVATPIVMDLTGEMTAKEVGKKKHFSKALR